MKVKLKIYKSVVVVLMLLCGVAYPQSEGRLSLQLEVDPANSLGIVDHVNEGFNGVASINYRREGLQFGLFYETFPKIDFQSVGLNSYLVFNEEGILNYLIGMQVSFIDRPSKLVPSLGVNGQLEYNINRFYVLGRAEYKMRHDVGKDIWRYSTFVGVGFKFN